MKQAARLTLRPKGRAASGSPLNHHVSLADIAFCRTPTMKTSELIARLQKIEKTVPFDAEVVMGDDWQPTELARVYHEPPYTFLEFADDEGREHPDEEPLTFNSQQQVLVSAYLSSILESHANKTLDTSQATQALLEFIEVIQTNLPSQVVAQLKAAATRGRG